MGASKFKSQLHSASQWCACISNEHLTREIRGYVECVVLLMVYQDSDDESVVMIDHSYLIAEDPVKKKRNEGAVSLRTIPKFFGPYFSLCYRQNYIHIHFKDFIFKKKLTSHIFTNYRLKPTS